MFVSEYDIFGKKRGFFFGLCKVGVAAGVVVVVVIIIIAVDVL